MGNASFIVGGQRENLNTEPGVSPCCIEKAGYAENMIRVPIVRAWPQKTRRSINCGRPEQASILSPGL